MWDERLGLAGARLDVVDWRQGIRLLVKTKARAQAPAAWQLLRCLAVLRWILIVGGERLRHADTLAASRYLRTPGVDVVGRQSIKNPDPESESWGRRSWSGFDQGGVNSQNELDTIKLAEEWQPIRAKLMSSLERNHTLPGRPEAGESVEYRTSADFLRHQVLVRERSPMHEAQAAEDGLMPRYWHFERVCHRMPRLNTDVRLMVDENRIIATCSSLSHLGSKDCFGDDRASEGLDTETACTPSFVGYTKRQCFHYVWVMRVH